jgi:hypothetical protein
VLSTEAGEETDDERNGPGNVGSQIRSNQTNLRLRLPWRYSRSAEIAQRTAYGFWSKESLSAWSRADVVRKGEVLYGNTDIPVITQNYVLAFYEV